MIATPPKFLGLITKAIPVGVGMASLFLGQALLARFMGPASFGSYSYLLTWVTVAALLAKAGHEWVLLKAIPARIRLNRIGEIRFLLVRAIKAVGLRAGLAAATLLALALIAGGTTVVSADIIIAGAALVIILALSEIRRALALAYGAIWYAEMPESVVKSLGLVLIAASASLTGGVSPGAMLWANMIITLLCTTAAAIIFVRCKEADIFAIPPIAVDTRSYDDLMKSMWLTNLLNIIIRNADILIIGLLTDFVSTGVYIAATRIAMLAAAPVMVLDRIVAPSISEAVDLGDHDRVRASSWEYAILSTTACVGLVLLMVFAGSHFISILFGDEYEGALFVTWILLIGHVANALTGPTGVLLSMAGAHRVLVVIASVGAVFYMGLLYILTPKYLAVGAASAFSATHTAKALMQVYFVRKNLGINPTVFRIGGFTPKPTI